jgi:arsenate reductase
LCRPSEAVLALLDRPVASFMKEDGEIIPAVGAGDRTG